MAVIVRFHGIVLWMQPNNTHVTLRGRFSQTLTENSIAIQNMRVQRYDRAVKDDNGSKKLVDLSI